MTKIHLIGKVRNIRPPEAIDERSTTRLAGASDKSIAVRIFLVCWLVFVLHFATNTVRELFPVMSLGDHFSFDVSEYAGLHPDIFEMPGRGTFVNNNPGASMLGAVPYLLLRPVTDRIVERVQRSRSENPQALQAKYDTIYPMAREFYARSVEKGFDVKFGLAAAITQALAMAPISAFGAVVMFWILLSVTGDRRSSSLLALLYAFATPILFRTAQLNQNALLAAFALFSFALLWRPWYSGREDRKPMYFAAGLCAGWGVVLDYSGLVAVAALGGYAFSLWLSQPKRDLYGPGRFVAGVGVCAFILMAYQWSSFGSPFLPAQAYMPPANFTELGYRGFSYPQIDLLFETAFSMRYGLFVSSPILLLAFAVPVWLRRSSGFLQNRELIFVVSFVILFFLFCSANQYGRMQFNTGVRHIVPVVPFIFLLAANVLFRMPGRISVPVALLATYWSWCLAMYRDVEQGLGVLEAVRHVTLEGLRLPWLTTLERMGFVHGAYAIPIVIISGIAIWLIWTVDRTPRTPVAG